MSDLGEWFVRLLASAEALPMGLCGNRESHEPHVHDSASLGRFWCCADESKRLPAAAERAWRPRETGDRP